MVGRVGFEPTMSFQRRIMSPLHSATVRPAPIKSITSTSIVVKKLLEIAIQFDPDSFMAAKHDDLFWYAFHSMYVVRHLQFSIQVQQSALIEVMRIGYIKLVSHKIQMLYKYCISRSGQAHAAGLSTIEPPCAHGRGHRHSGVYTKIFNQLLGQCEFVTHFKDISDRPRSAQPL